MKIYYWGAWGFPGHALFEPDGSICWRTPIDSPVYHRRIDGTYCGDPALARYSRGVPYWENDAAHQPQGIGRLHHVEGWTILAWWDRSVDARGGSNSAFAADATLSAAEILKLGSEAFQVVWARVLAASGVTLPVEKP